MGQSVGQAAGVVWSNCGSSCRSCVIKLWVKLRELCDQTVGQAAGVAWSNCGSSCRSCVIKLWVKLQELRDQTVVQAAGVVWSNGGSSCRSCVIKLQVKLQELCDQTVVQDAGLCGCGYLTLLVGLTGTLTKLQCFMWWRKQCVWGRLDISQLVGCQALWSSWSLSSHSANGPELYMFLLIKEFKNYFKSHHETVLIENVLYTKKLKDVGKTVSKVSQGWM